MSEVNERWQRDHRHLQRLTAAGIFTAGILWLLSFYASMPAAFNATVHEGWFGFASIVTFIGAVGLSIGSGIGIIGLLTDDPPSAGDNR